MSSAPDLSAPVGCRHHHRRGQTEPRIPVPELGHHFHHETSNPGFDHTEVNRPGLIGSLLVKLIFRLLQQGQHHGSPLAKEHAGLV